MTRALLLALCLATTTAHADVWQRAIDTTDSTKDRFEGAMRNGDELAQRANAKSQNRTMVTSLIDQAIRSYRDAATIVPTSAEPYFRIASLLESFFIDCETQGTGVLRPATCTTPADVMRLQELLAAYDEFEARSPLDPRVADILFSRAISRTKLATDPRTMKSYLEPARSDYQAMIDRADGFSELYDRMYGRMRSAWGNHAETLMMLGRLDEAIDAYKVALSLGSNASTVYGLAVALDRDEREAEALQLIRAQGDRSFKDFSGQFTAGEVFFVPKGEEFYYFALAQEAFGEYVRAIANWRLFIKSGAHPVYQPRAKAHLDALVIQHKTNPRPPPRPDVDYFP